MLFKLFPILNTNTIKKNVIGVFGIHFKRDHYFSSNLPGLLVTIDKLFEKVKTVFEKLEHTVKQSEPSDLFCTVKL